MSLRLVALAALLVAAVAARAAPQDLSPCTDTARFPQLAGSLCARLEAPLDHADPARGMIGLFLRQFPAKGQSRGQVWLIAGGPGESGASLYPLLSRLRLAFPGFDLMIPDHRGTGFSTRICPAEESPDSPGGAALVGQEWVTCLGSIAGAPERARAFSITNAAYDLQLLMNRYRSPGQSVLYGVSYGTELVLRTLRAAPPDKVDQVILDGLVPKETDKTLDLTHRTAVTDKAGRKFLVAAMGGRGETLLTRVEHDPVIADRLKSDPKQFFAQLLDFPAIRADIPATLESLSHKDYGPIDGIEKTLIAAAAPFAVFPQSPTSIPLAGIIGASENDLRPDLTEETVEKEAADALFVSPLPSMLTRRSFPVYPHDGNFGKDPERLPPTLILQGTLDPKTSYDGAIAHAQSLKDHGPLIFYTVEGAPHFLLFSAPDCFTEAARRFVLGEELGEKSCTLKP